LQRGGGFLANGGIMIGGQNAQRLDPVVCRKRCGIRANREASLGSRASRADLFN
jgi:hypothetical protein